MRFFVRGISALAVVLALFLAFIGGLSTSVAEAPASSRGVATVFEWVAVANLVLTVCVAGALLGKVGRAAVLAFSGVLVVDAALLVLWQAHCWSSCGPGG